MEVNDMQYTDTLFDEIRNVGYIDRGIRILTGSAAILFVLATHTAGALGWMAVIPLLAVYPIITGLISYDPFYAWLQIDTSKSSVISDENVLRLFTHISGEHPAQTSESDSAVQRQHTRKSSSHKDAA